MGDIKEGLGQSIIDGISPAMTWLLEKLQDVNDKIAKANRESGIISPSSMSDSELTDTWEARKPRSNNTASRSSRQPRLVISRHR